MTQKNRNGLLPEIKTLMSKEEDFLRPLVEWIVQQVLEVDMSEAVGAEKRERTERVALGGGSRRLPVSTVPVSLKRNALSPPAADALERLDCGSFRSSVHRPASFAVAGLEAISVSHGRDP